MSRRKSKLTFKEVVSFLKENGFTLHHTRGSHHYFKGFKGGRIRTTHIQYHGSSSIHPKTLSSVIQQSGISEEEWLNK